MRKEESTELQSDDAIKENSANFIYGEPGVELLTKTISHAVSLYADIVNRTADNNVQLCIISKSAAGRSDDCISVITSSEIIKLRLGFVFMVKYIELDNSQDEIDTVCAFLSTMREIAQDAVSGGNNKSFILVFDYEIENFIFDYQFETLCGETFMDFISHYVEEMQNHCPNVTAFVAVSMPSSSKDDAEEDLTTEVMKRMASLYTDTTGFPYSPSITPPALHPSGCVDDDKVKLYNDILSKMLPK